MPWHGQFHLTLLLLVLGPTLQPRLSIQTETTVKMGRSCQISLVSLEERSVCKALSNRRKCCSVMQFPCDSYSEILKTAMNEFFNFQLRRCTSQKSINRNHYIPSELVVQPACQPPNDRLWRHGQEEHRHFTCVFCNLFVNEEGKWGEKQHADWSPAIRIDSDGARRGGGCSTLKLQSSCCTRARSARQQ